MHYPNPQQQQTHYPPQYPPGHQPQHQMHPSNWGPQYSVTYVKTRTNHVFHIIMTMLTLGFWGAFVYLPLLIIRSKKHKQITYHH